MNDPASTSSIAPPDPPVPEWAGADWVALAQLAAGELPASAEERARADAARAWLAVHPGEAARVAALGRALDGARAASALTPSALVDAAPSVDVEAALARVRRAAQLNSGAPLDRAADSAGPQPQLTVVRGGAPRARGAEPVRATRRDVLMPRPMPAWRRAVGLLAASAVLAAGVTWWRTGGLAGRNLLGPAVAAGGTATPQRYTTGVGERQVLHLADGSQVVLGPASTLDVPAGYGGAVRRVRLTGEGYFRAVHDTQRPFEVAAADAIVNDIGTAFVVRAPGTPGQPVDVAVTTGAVQLRAAAGNAGRAAADSGVLLRAGDRGRVLASTTAGAPGTVAVVARGADVGSDTAWTTGRLVFHDTPLADVAGALRRWYGVELRFADSGVARRHLTATFAGESTDAVLHVIGLATGARLDRRGNTVVVWEAAPSR